MMTKEEKNAYNLTYRQTHQEAIQARRRAHYQAHKEELNARDRAYHLANLEQERARSRAYAELHREEIAARLTAYRKKLVVEALRALGSKCACPGCGVSEPVFLTIDHIQGHPKGPKSKGPKKSPIAEAKASGWDKTKFQILCFNCNCAKKDRGFCPVHQKDPVKSNGHIPGANAELTFSSVDREGGDTL